MRKLPIAWHLHLLSGVILIGVWLCFYANGFKHQTQVPNAPIRGSVWDFYHTTTTYTPSILHLTQTYCNSLVINDLLSVRYYKFHLHATYTPHMLPHGTSTGDRYHSIGEQESLLLRQIVLRPSGVQPAAYVQTDCKMCAGVCKIFWNHPTLLKPLYINLLRTKSVRWQ